jgi:NADPH:quinone reductase-like Zn-dependent oxidoreductase
VVVPDPLRKILDQMLRLHDTYTEELITSDRDLEALIPAHPREGRAHHGEILAEAAALVQAGKLKPLIHKEHSSPSRLDAAYALVESGSLGKVVVEI